MILEIGLASIFALLGIRSAIVSLRQTGPDDSPVTRLLVAVHSSAGAAVWFSIAGYFVLAAVTDDLYRFRWLGVVAIAMAGLRMIAAARLAMR